MKATAGIVLTGGRSRRLGVDKATLVLDGETLAQRAARHLEAVCAPVVEAGDGVSGVLRGNQFQNVETPVRVKEHADVLRR